MEGIVKKSDYFIFWGTCAFYVFFFLLLVSAYTPFKIIRGRFATRGFISTFFQVRYNVYVRETKEPVYNLYTLHNGIPEKYDLRPFVPKFNYGLKRDYKPVAQEIAMLFEDTTAIANARKYQLAIPAGSDISACIKADSLQFNYFSNKNIVLLHGRYLITMEQPLSWEQASGGTAKTKNITVLPVNISRKK
ncbi:MAG: hypothetical protein H7257_06210 [Taibaiella sp.]|nr:hypothetical protein [Taibaiella sp.]